MIYKGDHFWICDQCHDVIENPDLGWVEWLSDKGDYHAQDPRIVCNAETTPHSCSLGLSTHFDGDAFSCTGKELSDFVGKEGVGNVFNYLGIGEFSASQARALLIRLLFGDD